MTTETTPGEGTTTPAIAGATPETAAIPATPEVTPAPAGKQEAAPPKADPGTKPGSLLGDAVKTDGQPEKTPGTTEEPFEIKLPEGVTDADKPMFDSFTTTAKELGLKGEQAQKLVDFYAGVMGERNKAAAADWEKRQAEDRKALETSPSIGGAKLEATRQDVRKAVLHLDRTFDGLGTRAVKQLETRYAAGNDPVIAELFARIGSALAEDSIGGKTAGEKTPTTEEERMAKRYPSHAKLSRGA